METFYNWPDAVKYLHTLITRSQPLPGQGVVIEQISSGRRINTTDSGISGNAKYSGPFKLEATNEKDVSLISVVNPAHPKSSPCGLVSVGGKFIEVPLFFEEPEENAGYVILTINYSGTAPEVIYSAEIMLENTVPEEYADGVWKKIIVLGTYSIVDSLLTVKQSWLSGDVYVTDRVV